MLLKRRRISRRPSVANQNMRNVDLSKLADSDKLTRDEQIELNKMKSKREKADEDSGHCLFCDADFRNSSKKKGRCNSHSVPKEVLKRLTVSGCPRTINSIINFDGAPKKVGNNNAGTFGLICRECDSKVFSEYETYPYDNEIGGEPDDVQRILAEIALKDYLFEYDRSLQRKQGYKGLGASLIKDYNNFLCQYDRSRLSTARCAHVQDNLDRYRVQIQSCNDQVQMADLDIKDFKEQVKETKRFIDSINDGLSSEKRYEIWCQHVFDCTVPLACQGLISPECSFKNEVLNNRHNPDECIQSLHIAIFPLNSGKTFILAFSEVTADRLGILKDELRKMCDKEQLKALLTLFMMYSEDVFLSDDSVADSVLSNDSLRRIAGYNGTIAYNRSKEPSSEDYAEEAYSILSLYKKIPDELLGLSI